MSEKSIVIPEVQRERGEVGLRSRHVWPCRIYLAHPFINLLFLPLIWDKSRYPQDCECNKDYDFKRCHDFILIVQYKDKQKNIKAKYKRKEWQIQEKTMPLSTSGFTLLSGHTIAVLYPAEYYDVAVSKNLNGQFKEN